MATAKVAGRGPKGPQAPDPDGPVPPGTATLDVVSPGRRLAQIKKLGAAAGGVVAALLAALWLAGGKGSEGDGQGTVPARETRTARAHSAPRAPSAVEMATPAVAPAPAIPTTPSPTPPPPTSAPELTTKPPPALFFVSVTTDPDDAEIELDGEPAGVGRLRLSLPADHRRHVLRATSAGFAPRVVEFTDHAPQRDAVADGFAAAARGVLR